MCSWCWGFANVITELLENYEDKLEFEILLGGLRPTNEVKVDEKMKDFSPAPLDRSQQTNRPKVRSYHP